MNGTEVKINIDEIIGPSIWHRSIRWDTLSAARKSTGFTQKKFAELCGHTPAFESILESKPKDLRNGDCHEITLATAQAIKKVLADFK